MLFSGVVCLGAFTQGSVGLAFAIISAPLLPLIVPWAVPVTVILLTIPVTLLSACVKEEFSMSAR